MIFGEHRRVLLWQRIGILRRVLFKLSLNDPAISEVGSAIHPIMVGDERAAIELSRALQMEGLLAPAIRYPTVARGAARLRVTVSASHEEPQIHTLVQALNRLRPGLNAAA